MGLDSSIPSKKSTTSGTLPGTLPHSDLSPGVDDYSTPPPPGAAPISPNRSWPESTKPTDPVPPDSGIAFCSTKPGSGEDVEQKRADNGNAEGCGLADPGSCGSREYCVMANGTGIVRCTRKAGTIGNTEAAEHTLLGNKDSECSPVEKEDAEECCGIGRGLSMSSNSDKCWQGSNGTADVAHAGKLVPFLTQVSVEGNGELVEQMPTENDLRFSGLGKSFPSSEGTGDGNSAASEDVNSRGMVAQNCGVYSICSPLTSMMRPSAIQNGSLRRSPRFSVSSSRPPAPASQEGNSADGRGSRPTKRTKLSTTSKENRKTIPPRSETEVDPDCFFVGNPVPEDEARTRWPHHYVIKDKRIQSRSNNSWNGQDEYISGVKCHYYQASIIGCIFNLGDCAYVKGVDGEPNYIGRILEFFETMEDKYYFTVQWFFRAEDTVLKEQTTFHDKRRLFLSDLKNDNLLECIVSKVEIQQLLSNVDLKAKRIPPCDYYYDMKYSLDYSTFYAMHIDESYDMSDLTSSNITETIQINNSKQEVIQKKLDNNGASEGSQLTLLDLYSGCGGMSTGLCFGARIAGINLVTKWAIDFNEAACKSLKLNHPESHVRNESGLDFFDLLKEWEKLCKRFLTEGVGKKRQSSTRSSVGEDSKINSHDDVQLTGGEFEVLKLVDICYGDPMDTGKRGLKFKVRWKGYGPSDDTWEPMEGLRSCQDRICEFVNEGFKSKILPLPGDVDVICGGPPCQGISGLNRHRNVDAPLEDEKNKQIIVFMDIVQFLKPKYVLMENVVDILKLANGTLGRYALGRLVHMNYQARLGIMAAGSYGLPQFRLRAFFLGSHPSKKLPPFPLPTHDVVVKCGAPTEFERNVVAYNEGQPRNLEKALVLEDAISDLPAVTMEGAREQMHYGRAPKTEFQKYIRSSKHDFTGSSEKKSHNTILYDHRPLQLGEENYTRVCQVPRRKGACFRDLPGVVVWSDNSVHLDPNMERVLLPNGKPLVPDYCFTFADGKATRPFARLWWDETVPTVLTTADPHFQASLHPEQDRALTIRENARLQGFPDFYRFCGTIKERYCQVGNAVAIPVGRALGYAMGVSWQMKQGSRDEPLMILPPNFSHSLLPLQHLATSSSEVLEG